MWVKLKTPIHWALEESISQVLLVASTHQDSESHQHLMIQLMNQLEDPEWESTLLLNSEPLSLTHQLNQDLCGVIPVKE